MKIVRCGIAAGLLAGLGACSNMTGSSAAPQPSAAAQPPVAPDMARQVQSKLHDDGYYRQGALDGVWDSGTQASLRSFQRDHNLVANGALDMPTLQALNLPGSTTSNAANNNPQPTQPNYNPPPPANNTKPAQRY
jgi:peptidoglycan hydrolase-like protein with peptidoglycan-binding domain